ncbi:MAG: hypothetical protein L0Z07_06270 [Planctomycetes bacterium]|nr:hypothetical protein [Planctomycetota bacterium]
MKTRQAVNVRRDGLSLLELMAATAMMATLMASVVVVVRSGYAIWTVQQDDLDRLENAYGVLRHLVREVRQADSVAVISAPSDTSGDVSLLTASGVTRAWSHNAATGEVSFNNGVNNQLLARNIDQIVFVGYKADGVTQSTIVEEIQLLECRVQVTLPNAAGPVRTVSSRAWIRSW